ncbi:MAG: hypothetical protein Q9227_007814 [Pyrenula ochraceoflavens]
MPRRPALKQPQKKERDRLTLAQLASYDDVLTDALVDRTYYWSRIRKNRTKYFPIRGVQEGDVTKILLHEVICEKDPVEAEEQLLELSGLRKYVNSLKTGREKDNFKRHLRKYINMYLPDSPFEVSTTNRYTITTQEACVIARRRICKGETIKYLSGTLVAVTPEEEKDLEVTKRNFSIVLSSRKKTSSMFLGPARFANHDCDANGALKTTGSDGMEVVATRNIEVGDEITVTYGESYFGPNNEECLCQSCENHGRSGWALGSGESLIDSSDRSTPAPEPEGPYSFRRKRKYEAELSVGTPRSGSVTPLKRRRNRRLSPKPIERNTPPPSAEVQIEDSIELAPCRLPMSPNLKRKFPEECGLATPDSVDFQDRSFKTAEAECQDNMTFPERTSDHQPKKRKRLVDLMMSSPVSTSPTQDAFPAPTKKPEDCVEQTSSMEILPVMDAGFNTDVKIEPAEAAPKDIQTFPSSPERQTVLRKEPEQLGTPASSQSSSEPLESQETASVHDSSVVEATEPAPAVSQTVIESIETQSTSILNTTIKTSTSTTTLSISTARVPGDYRLNPRLLPQPYDRWVHCQTCTNPFVQPNGYQTRRECPRCERHSKLYGFGWPKTENQGRNDTEERILDHRTVHRFVFPEEEKEIRRKGSVNGSLSKRGLGSLGLGRDDDGLGSPLTNSTPELRRSFSREATEGSGNAAGMRRSKRWRKTLLMEC